MNKFSLALSIMLALSVAGCATTSGKGSDTPHVLSGNAPVTEVIRKGDESFQNGDFRAAAILYQIAVNQESDPEYWFKLGTTQVYLNNQEMAVHAFYQTLELEPEHQGALEKLGLHYTARGDVERARTFLEKLVVVNADNWKAHNALGVLADLNENFDVARDHYTDALKLRPDLAVLWNNLGYSVYLLGDLSLASTYLQRALELDPAHEAARLNLALVYIRRGQHEQALSTFFETKEVGEAYTKVGYLAYKVGQYDKATQYLQEAIRRSPSYNKTAHDYLAAARQAKRASG